MKSPRFICLVLPALLVLGLTALLPVARGAGTNVSAGAKGKPGTNAANAILPIPVSVFEMTSTPTKDPFFPLSLRRPASAQAATNAAPGISVNSFQLMALSGSTDARLAMINHRTLSVGESTEVTMPSGSKATIRVVQIKDTSVIIRVITPPQPELIELSLSKRAQ